MQGRSRVLALLLALAAAGAAAEGYPERPVRFIVPFPSGGGTDAFARLIGAKLTELWGQQVIIDNRGGAQGNIGTALAARATPDGYTILLAHQGALAINPHLYSHPGFDPLLDFAAVSRGTGQAMVLVANPAVQAATLKELVQLARMTPGQLTFASAASTQQLAGELFKLATGTDLLHVPYKGAGTAVVDVLGGDVSLMFASPISIVQHVHTGRLRALAVFGPRRNDALPGTPTAAEAGYPGLGDLIEWYGVAVPAGTSQYTVSTLNAALVRVLSAPDVVERMHAVGQDAAPSTADEFAALIRADYERWGKIVKAAHVKVH